MIFELIVFLLVEVEIRGRKNALRFVHAGDMTVIVPLIILSLAKHCKDKCLSETDVWDTKTVKSQEAIETVGQQMVLFSKVEPPLKRTYIRKLQRDWVILLLRVLLT